MKTKNIILLIFLAVGVLFSFTLVVYPDWPISCDCESPYAKAQCLQLCVIEDHGSCHHVTYIDGSGICRGFSGYCRTSYYLTCMDGHTYFWTDSIGTPCFHTCIQEE
ncbi:MAG: hypothetical protein GF317_06730 [Candidatus Lokiarchaeota archaeon]|nr:hypothetical protein [Candidatus Lokiarchaeota archaeon]